MLVIGLHRAVEEIVDPTMIGVRRHWLSALKSKVVRLVLVASKAAAKTVHVELVDVLSSGVLQCRCRVSEQVEGKKISMEHSLTLM
jgi:hypothetical protein